MSNFDKMAADLRAAYSGKTIPPLRPDLDPNDVDGAYAIQQVNTTYWEQQGRKIVGRKIGLTSPAVQKQLERLTQFSVQQFCGLAAPSKSY